MPDVEISDLCYTYTDGKEPRPALRGMSLHIRDGELCCVIGDSGSGKSTLLRILAGLAEAGEGTVRIGGEPVEGPCSDRMLMFQDCALFPWMTARKNIAFAASSARRLSRREARETADRLLEQVGMADAGELYPFQLSGGMRQRVAIARALAADPALLLLDEPFGALDAGNRTRLQDLLLELWAGKSGRKKTVVFVTHDIGEAIRLGDRVAFMDGGAVRDVIPIDLPRPRTDEKAAEPYRDRLLELFRERGGET